MRIGLAASFLLLFLAGCASTGPTSNEEATAALEKKLVWGKFVSYKELARFPGDVLCGQYKDMDPWTGEGEFQHFAVVRGEVYENLTDIDRAIFCTTDSAGALEAQLGIGPLSDADPGLAKIYSDFEQLVDALEAFQSNNGFYPTTDEGLSLLTGNAPGRRQVISPSEGYINPVPNDPWERPYRYYSQPFAGVKGNFQLWTLGADNAKGGTGANADIRHEYLKYLDHVSSLR